MLSEEQEELRRVLRSFLVATSPMAVVRRLMETEEGYDPLTWRRMADELGLHALAIPEAYGGAGFGWAELGIVFDELGRALAGGPFLASVAMAAGAVLASGDEAAAGDLLGGIAAGETIATLAVVEDRGRWDATGVTLAASADGRLTGHKSYVLDGGVAGLILVAARTVGADGADGADGISLYAVDGDAPGLSRTPIPTLDLTRKLARLEFAGTPARLVGPAGHGGRAVEAGLAWGAVALANEQVGGAQRCLDMAVAHAKSRTQFGRPIGSFQAVKHKCADLLREIESARSTAAAANWTAGNTGPSATGPADTGPADAHRELRVAASLAKVACSEAYLHAASDCIQIHGALGFTWDHDAHLFFKRAKSSLLLLGDPTYHRGVLAGLLGL